MTTRNKHVVVCIPKSVFRQIREEAKRQERTTSWLLRQAWKLTKKKFLAMPTQPKDPNRTRARSDRSELKTNTTIYLDNEEIRCEAKRLDRSVGWLLSRAWMLAYNTISRTPDLPWK